MPESVVPTSSSDTSLQDDPSIKTLIGRVIRTQSGFFTVNTEAGLYTCQISGKLKINAQRAVHKEEEQRSDLVALNDWVTIEVHSDDAGMITEVEEREHVLSRVAPGASVGTSAESEQIILANTDQVVFIFAAKNPSPRLRALDRLLVIAEKAEIPSIIICVNKIDLVKPEEVKAIFSSYETIGYAVIYVSAVTGENLEQLRKILTGNDNKVSVFTGSSGVGKSSLLNALQEGLKLETSHVSEATTKGRHTTRFSQLIKFDAGGYVADTPGIRSITLWDIEPHELDNYFIEMRPFIENCKFKDCSHRHEPDCAVLMAVKKEHISSERYQSYLRLREELEEYFIY